MGDCFVVFICYYVLVGIVVVILFNVLLCGVVCFGGLLVSLLIVVLVVGGLVWWFVCVQWCWLIWGECLCLVVLYGGVFGVFYLLLVGFVLLKGDFSLVVLFIVVLYYLCYLVLLLVFFFGRVYGFFLC